MKVYTIWQLYTPKIPIDFVLLLAYNESGGQNKLYTNLRLCTISLTSASRKRTKACMWVKKIKNFLKKLLTNS